MLATLPCRATGMLGHMPGSRSFSSIPMPISEDQGSSSMGLGLGSAISPLLPSGDEGGGLTPSSVVERLDRYIIGQVGTMKKKAHLLLTCLNAGTDQNFHATALKSDSTVACHEL